VHIVEFTVADGPAGIADELGRVGAAAEAVGVSELSVMDHWFQMDAMFPADDPMLEGYSTLAFLAAHTETVRIGTLVTGVTYRHPGLLAKTVTTLDVLSEGRAQLGIGAAWYEREHKGLGVPFPPTAERFERLEETLQICLQMWDPDDNGPYEGRHYQLAETLCVPLPLSRPRPPILIGGSGERKTLRLVAQYADACNFFDLPAPFAEDLPHKLDVLRAHCEAVGRDYDAIEKTTLTAFDLSDGRAAGLRRLVAHVEELAGLGIGHVILMGPRFDWGDGLGDLDAVLSVADDLRAVEAVTV
jgi:F420-dependent oxidoreductase-like protein